MNQIEAIHLIALSAFRKARPIDCIAFDLTINALICDEVYFNEKSFIIILDQGIASFMEINSTDDNLSGYSFYI